MKDLHDQLLAAVADWIEERTGYRLDAAECQAMLSPKVKPLAWREEFSDLRADCADGWYRVYHWWLDSPRQDAWELSLMDKDNEIRNEIGDYESAGAAQAAAQSHWERRANEFFKEAFE